MLNKVSTFNRLIEEFEREEELEFEKKFCTPFLLGLIPEKPRLAYIADVKSFNRHQRRELVKRVVEEIIRAIEDLPNATMEYQTDGGNRSVKVELKAKFTKSISSLLSAQTKNTKGYLRD